MEYHSYCPGPPLEGFVESLWSLSDAPPHARERILPSGTLELVINLHEDEFRIYDASESLPPRRLRGAIVSGAYHGPFVIDTKEHAYCDRGSLRAGRRRAIPRRSARTARRCASGYGDAVAPAGLGAPRALVRGALACQALSYPRDALVARLGHPFKHHRAVRAALEHIARPGMAVADVADHVGLSHRRLIELFTAEVGVPPKLFGRLQRFQRAVAVVQEAPSVDWAQLAVRCGYYNQSHLIRDFGEFSGFSPAGLLRLRSDRVKASHVAPSRYRQVKLVQYNIGPPGSPFVQGRRTPWISLERDTQAHRAPGDRGRAGQRRRTDDDRSKRSNENDHSKERHARGRVAFDLARKRRNKVTSMEKRNVMKSGVLWNEVMTQVHAREYKDVTLEHQLADSGGMMLVKAPKQFDVIVTDNLFGDMLSDIAAMLTGSLGMLPSASLGEVDAKTKKRRSLFEPVHGSAPDIAGQGLANPIAMISSFGMALRYSFDMGTLADKVDAAIAAVLASGLRTADIKSEGTTAASTTQMGEAILKELQKLHA